MYGIFTYVQRTHQPNVGIPIPFSWMVWVIFVTLEGSLVKKCVFKTVLPTRKVPLDPRKTLQPLTQCVVNFTQNLKNKDAFILLSGFL